MKRDQEGNKLIQNVFVKDEMFSVVGKSDEAAVASSGVAAAAAAAACRTNTSITGQHDPNNDKFPSIRY